MPDDPGSAADGSSDGGTHNVLNGTHTGGPVVQAGSVQGGVHFHPAASVPVTPRQLPAAVQHFVGRQDAIDVLGSLLAQGEDAGGTVVISAIFGTAGVGKTALAVYWAHRIADRYPDGQLYVNLHGFDPTDEPTSFAEVIRGFLDAFEVPPDRIPASLDAQAALYRSLLAGRRVLVVLDNARNAEHVRPLLPGSTSCLVLVTSRDGLAGLVAEGARPITLDVFTPEEATDLLTKRLGHGRVKAEQEAVRELIEHCVRLPLALALTAARAATNPGFPLQALADELRDEHDLLDALDTGEQATGVRAVFSWSYRALGEEAARLFRLLGLHPGAHIGLPAAASLAGVPLPAARRLLAELTRTHLVDEFVPGRYRMHDLLRAYAVERASEDDSKDDRRAAVTRLLDHYLHVAYAAERCLYPHRDPISLGAPAAGTVLIPMDDYQRAMEWFTAEHSVLLAATQRAADLRMDAHAWQLPWSLSTFVYRQGHWHDYHATQRTAAAAADRLGDPAVRATTYRFFGHACMRLGDYPQAIDRLRETLVLDREIGDRDGEARTNRFLGWAYEWQGRYADALPHVEAALALWRGTGHRAGEAEALESVGWCRAQLGDFEACLAHCEPALEIHRGLGDRTGEAIARDSLGYAHHHLGRYDEAIGHFERVLVLWEELGDRYREAGSAARLGDARMAQAEHAWRRALTVFTALGHADADAVRDKLARLGDDTGQP